MTEPELIRDIWEAENKEDGTCAELMNLGHGDKDDIWITVGTFDTAGNRLDGATVELTRDDLTRLHDALGRMLGKERAN